MRDPKSHLCLLDLLVDNNNGQSLTRSFWIRLTNDLTTQLNAAASSMCHKSLCHKCVAVVC
jgi:hypothetical protein